MFARLERLIYTLEQFQYHLSVVITKLSVIDKKLNWNSVLESMENVKQCALDHRKHRFEIEDVEGVLLQTRSELNKELVKFGFAKPV
jgi:KaiC/GvpD/RAD55 family RecA-like ATPase